MPDSHAMQYVSVAAPREESESAKPLIFPYLPNGQFEQSSTLSPYGCWAVPAFNPGLSSFVYRFSMLHSPEAKVWTLLVVCF